MIKPAIKDYFRQSKVSRAFLQKLTRVARRSQEASKAKKDQEAGKVTRDFFVLDKGPPRHIPPTSAWLAVRCLEKAKER